MNNNSLLFYCSKIDFATIFFPFESCTHSTRYICIHCTVHTLTYAWMKRKHYRFNAHANRFWFSWFSRGWVSVNVYVYMWELKHVTCSFIVHNREWFAFMCTFFFVCIVYAWIFCVCLWSKLLVFSVDITKHAAESALRLNCFKVCGSISVSYHKYYSSLQWSGLLKNCTSTYFACLL